MSSSREDQQAAQPSSQQQAQQREPHHHALPPEQAARAVAHLKAALSDVASEEGATIAYGEGAAGAQPRAVGTMASDLEGRDFIVAPSADGRRVDVVERIDLASPEAIRTDLKRGFGARAGPHPIAPVRTGEEDEGPGQGQQEGAAAKGASGGSGGGSA